MRTHSLALTALAALTLSGCTTPKLVSYYDDKCQVMTRRLELDIARTQTLAGCSNQQCISQALGGLAVFAASSVISGTVVVVGNVAYWMERSVNCKPKEAAAAPAKSASSS